MATRRPGFVSGSRQVKQSKVFQLTTKISNITVYEEKDAHLILKRGHPITLARLSPSWLVLKSTISLVCKLVFDLFVVFIYPLPNITLRFSVS